MNEAELIRLRNQLLEVDMNIIQLLGHRNKIALLIGELKRKNCIEVEQIGQWENCSEQRKHQAEIAHVDQKLVNEIFELIHNESKKIQNESEGK
jgi:chorismate mutase